MYENRNPKISVIIPVYNVEGFIDRCIKSVVNQTLQDIEIIIVNDGSQDNSELVIKKYLNSEKIKYFKKENGGLSSARNFGINRANGEYIAFLDSDDYIDSNMYEEMYRLAKKENADMVECDFVKEWEESKIEIHKNNKRNKNKKNYEKKRKYKKIYDKRRKYKNKRDMMIKPRVVAWNRIIKTEIIKNNDIKFPNGLIYEDLEFYFKILPYIENISYINKYFVHYTQRENSISNTQSVKNEDIFQILKNIIEFYKTIGLYKKYEKELKLMSKRILLGSSMKRILKISDYKTKFNLILKTMNFLFGSKKENICKNKICFGITKLGIGGAERVLVDIVNELVNDSNYEITIFTIYSGGELEKEVDIRVKLISFTNKEIDKNIIPIFSAYILIFGRFIYNKFLKNKYNVNIAFLEGPITRIFSYGSKKIRKIAWVHNDIQKVFGKSFKAKLKNIIDKKLYKKYDKIVFVSKQNKESFENLYGNISNRIIIKNYINKERVIRNSNKSIDNKEKIDFLSVCRLTNQKGIDRFIRVHKKLINNGFNHNVYVIGDGPEKDKLNKLIVKLGVENTFILLGEKNNPYPYIKQAKYITLLSYYEGYGMIIEEAKILNKTIIITKTAATEAVYDYHKSLVIENEEEDIYQKLKVVLSGKYNFWQNHDSEIVYDNQFIINEIKELF